MGFQESVVLPKARMQECSSGLDEKQREHEQSSKTTRSKIARELGVEEEGWSSRSVGMEAGFLVLDMARVSTWSRHFSCGYTRRASRHGTLSVPSRYLPRTNKRRARLSYVPFGTSLANLGVPPPDGRS